MKYISILAFLLMISACAGTTPPTDGVNESPQFLSLTPASLGRSLSLSQMVTGQHDGRNYIMRYELEITPERLAMVGLSPLGVTLFTIVLEQGKLTTESLTKKQMGFDTRHILFDLHLTYWPRGVLQDALSPLKMRLEDTDDGSIRRVRRLNGDLVAEIKYSSKQSQKSEIVIQHFDIPYRLRVETLSTGIVR